MNTPCPLTRRQFALSLGGVSLGLAFGREDLAAMPWNQPATVAKVYLCTPGQVHWPKPALDVQHEIAEVEAKLGEVARKNAHNVRFVGGAKVGTVEEIKALLASAGEIDGLLIIPVSQPLPVLNELLDSVSVPSLFFSRPYATHSWSGIGALQKKGRKIDVIATSSYGDLDPYMRAFKTARHLRTSRILVGDAKPQHRQEQAAGYTKHYGTSFKFLSGSEFREAFASASETAAQKAAAEFVRGALKVVEPSPKEISDGLRFYLGLANLLKQEKANAVTIDCFGTMAANTLPAYPCIAFAKFNDAGMYGVCEGDLASTMTQMLVTSYSNKPGFVTDPVFDISRNEVIHAHCVSATKMMGLDGPASPYIIRNHLETNEGAVLQVLMPSGEPVTVARYTGPDRVLVSAAQVTGLPDSDRGCRSQVRTRVPDAEKWLRNYNAGLHRVMFYGDHRADIRRLGRLLAFDVFDEMES